MPRFGRALQTDSYTVYVNGDDIVNVGQNAGFNADYRFAEYWSVNGGYRYLGSLGREKFGDRPADAGGAAGYQRYFVCQSHTVLSIDPGWVIYLCRGGSGTGRRSR